MSSIPTSELEALGSDPTLDLDGQGRCVHVVNSLSVNLQNISCMPMAVSKSGKDTWSAVLGVEWHPSSYKPLVTG